MAKGREGQQRDTEGNETEPGAEDGRTVDEEWAAWLTCELEWWHRGDTRVERQQLRSVGQRTVAMILWSSRKNGLLQSPERPD